MTPRRIRIVAATLGAVLLIATLLIAVLGTEIWPLVAVAVVPWLLIAAGRWGLRLAIPVIGVGGLWALLVGGTLLPFSGLPALGTSVVVLTLVAIGGIVAVFFLPLPEARGVARMAHVWMPPLVGAGAWLIAVAANRSGLSWAMQGDSANNVLFARVVIDDGGIALGATDNPVPLPAALVALGALPGREGVAAAALLEHDVHALAVVWALVIAGVAYTSGLAATALIPVGRKVTIMLVGALASLLPMSWFVTGYPIEFGFLGMHIALLVVLFAWCAAVSYRHSPGVSLAALLTATTVLLGVWSPLAAIPAALAAALGVVALRAGHLPRRDIAVALGGVVQVVLYVALVTAPAFFAQREFLSADGGIHRFSRVALFSLPVIAIVVAVVLLLRTTRKVEGIALLAITAGGGIALGALLFLSRNEGNVWTYYPVKAAWFLDVVGLVVLGGGLVAASAVLLRGRVLRGVAAVLVGVVTFGLVAIAPRALDGLYPWHSPARALVEDAYYEGQGREIADLVFASANAEHPTLYWDSGEPGETIVNFWVLQSAAGMEPSNFDLRVYAYGTYDVYDIADLCDIAEQLDRPLTVVSTRDLIAELQAECAATSDAITVVRT